VNSMKNGRYFNTEFFKFQKELMAHNEREWFLRNKERYETSVRDPFLRFIADLASPLRQIDSHYVADPRPTGGSMMRIYRDTRFARDKRPYKTAVAAHFWHAMGKGETAPAYYLHLEPGSSAIGAGMWRPEPPALRMIRDAIVADPKRWRRATSGGEFRSSCGMSGESLKRPPAGYDPDHPFIDDLKRKDFTVSSPLADAQVCGDEVLELVLKGFRTAAPFVEFLANAVGLA
jgi:uncharacterized protein (TIGR02453 family)